MGVEKDFITINSQKLYYTKYGEGKKPIVVLLGWLSNLDKFPYNKAIGKSNFNLEKYSFYFVHLSGLYKSDIPKKAYTLEDYTKELRNFILRKKLKKPVLIGHSAGGRYVIKYASQFPTKVNKIVLMASAGAKPLKPSRKQLSRVAYYFHKFIPLRKKSKKILQETFKNLYTYNFKEDMKSIKAKTLILWGAKDTTIRQSRAKIFSENIRNSKISVYKGYGHMITYQKSIFNRINKFIDEE